MAVHIPGAIFLHIPKTGGTFIRNYFRETNLMLSEIGHEHANGQVIRELVDPTEDVVFCFVRHPLTWYRSYWQMRQDHPEDRTGGPIDELVDQSFNEFIKSVINKYPGYLTGFFNGYVSRCRMVGRQESLREDLNCILTMMRIPYNKQYLFNRPVDNTTEPTEKYTIQLATEVLISEIELIKKFNYLYIPREVVN